MFDYPSSKYLKKRRVRSGVREIETHEIFLDKLAQKREKETGLSEKKFEVPLSRTILRGFFLLFFLVVFFLFVKTFQYQIVEGKKYDQLSQRNNFKIYQIQAERGVIYDQGGEQLIWNNISFDLAVNADLLPKDASERAETLVKVADILKMSTDEINQKIADAPDHQVLIKKNLEHPTLVILEAKIGELPGLEIVQNWIRDYRNGQAFSHLIGYTGMIRSEELAAASDQYSIFDWVGRSGLEKSYEELLRKNPGKLQIAKDAQGQVIAEEVVSLPQSGKSLVLWVDAGLQRKTREELEKALIERGAKYGTAIALNPKTGSVLALVSLPDYDNNLFQKNADPVALSQIFNNPQQPLLNRAIAGLYPTGSTIKPLIASAALQENIISPDKKIYDAGQITVVNKYNPKIVYTYKDLKAHGSVDMRRALAVSCNVYFYTVGGGYKDQKGLGPTLIKKYLELFGWNQKTQIDIPGEKQGLVPSPEWKKEVKKESWKDGDTYHMSIGQGDLAVTPLEVAASFAAIANGGKLFEPQVVQKIITGTISDPETVQEVSARIIRENFIDPENLQIVREGMRQAVTSSEGSSYFLNSLPVRVAAKTGTAETGKNNYYDKWINVFAPYENPEIVLTIMVENVQGYQTTLLPAARNILEWYFTREKQDQ